MGLLIFMSVVLCVCAYAVIIYNKLVQNKNQVNESYSGIDVQMKRRYDLIPNLVEIVKGYAKHEQKLFEDITLMRSRAQGAQDPQDRFQAEAGLSRALANVFAVSENYPDLKANINFIELQKQLAEVEDTIQNARRYYNGSVRDFNTMIEQFPSSLIASRFRFEVRPYFELENQDEKHPVQISF